jgi:hypothetical protein
MAPTIVDEFGEGLNQSGPAPSHYNKLKPPNGRHFASSRREPFPIDQRAGVRLFKRIAVAALLIALWGFLIFGDLLSHLGGCLSDRTK